MRIALILNFNNYQQTIFCCDNVLNTSVKKIIIVDNHSTNKSFSILKNNYKDIDCVSIIETSSNQGYASGNNCGLNYIATDCGVSSQNIIYILNPDSDIGEDNIDSINTLIETHQCVGAVTVSQQHNLFTAWHCLKPARALLFNSRIITRIVGHFGYREVIPYKFNLREINQTIPVDVVSGAFFGIRQDVLMEVGGFDEGTFLYYEEEALAAKLKSLGKQNYLLTTSTYIHKGQGSTSLANSKILKINAQSRLYFLKKYRHVNQAYILIYKLTNRVDEWIWSLFSREQ